MPSAFQAKYCYEAKKEALALQKMVSLNAPVEPVPHIESKAQPKARDRSVPIVLTAVLFTFLTCYLRDFVLPGVPIMSWGDQMLFATNGTRILAGRMPYRDYFLFLTPGTDLTYSLLFRWFGVKLWIPNLTMVCLGAIAVGLMMLVARRVLHGTALALPALFAVGFALTSSSLDATHHWFSTILAMGAMLVLMHGLRARHLVLAGTLCGLTASFTQTKGALVTAGFLFYLLWNSIDRKEPARIFWRRSLLLSACALCAFLAINLHFILLAGFNVWVQSVLIFPVRYYPALPGQTGFHLWSQLRDQGILNFLCIAFLYGSVFAVYPFFFFVMFRRRRIEPSQPWNQLLLIGITGFSMFLTVASATTLLRVSTISLPALVLLAWLLRRVKGKILLVGKFLAVLSFGIALYQPLRLQSAPWHYLTLPAGRSAIADQGRYELFQWAAEHTHPGEVCFGLSYIYLPLHLYSPAPIDSPGPWPYYRPEQIAASIAAIERNKIPILLLKPYSDDKSIWSYKAEGLRAFRTYLDLHYRLVKSFATPGGNEAWERRQ